VQKIKYLQKQYPIFPYPDKEVSKLETCINPDEEVKAKEKASNTD
jgi:hypothetical protein